MTHGLQIYYKLSLGVDHDCFKARSTLVVVKTVVILWEKLSANDQIDRRFIYMKRFGAQGVVCPSATGLYLEIFSEI